MNLPNPVDFAIPAFILLVLAEMVVARLRDRRRYCPKDTLTSLTLGFGSSIAGLLSGGLIFGMAVWVYQFRLVEIGWPWWAWIACASCSTTWPITSSTAPPTGCAGSGPATSSTIRASTTICRPR